MLFSESSSRLKVRACVRVSATGTFMCSCDGYRNVYVCVCQLKVRLCVRVSATGTFMCACVCYRYVYVCVCGKRKDVLRTRLRWENNTATDLK